MDNRLASGRTTTPRLRLHVGEAASTTGIGARGCSCSMHLVVEASHLRGSSGVAEDPCRDPLPAELTLVAERDDALWAGFVRGQFVFESRLFLDRSEPANLPGSHFLVDLVGREAGMEEFANPLPIRRIVCR